ncbi:hypothetical protein AAFX91_08250 [Bradyrhizobium sp. 31Argb]|uniref:hypothetical protein n=1 Tax=Bradyrhizobium sp. 31Argb TaxID=3141247 RepID=UPI00374788B1
MATAARSRTSSLRITDEMLDLYEAGLQLVAAGHDDVDDESEAHDEFKRIDKALSWSLLHIVSLSVFDRSVADDEMPSYMTGRPVGEDWVTMRQWRKALQAALDARRSKA